jgi:N-acetylglutamate synthase-like GNAT family acetyltransferase
MTNELEEQIAPMTFADKWHAEKLLKRAKKKARKLPIKRLSKQRKRAKHFWQKTKRAN